MPRTTKTTRLAVLAASTAAAAGAVLFPATAFAGSPATAPTVATDGSGNTGNGSSAVRRGGALPDGSEPDDSERGGVLTEDPAAPQQRQKPWWAPGQWWKHGNHQMQCFAAPCGPPGVPAGGGPNPATGPGSLGGDTETGGGSLSVFG
ncbi:hypothetical protein WDV06_02880 [Streptomyces racemochromogenes]|uniref:Secreted protein n=1 Tax=Streptomyces racemochromogenes TaxID=67353 RepID=A0ABW7P6S6_9ACTN